MCSSASGRFTRKSSPFSPVSSKASRQSLMHNHMMVHYDKIRNATSVIDNKPPAAMTSHIKAKDRKRREEKKRQRSSRLQSTDTDLAALNETMAAIQSGRWHDMAHLELDHNGESTYHDAKTINPQTEQLHSSLQLNRSPKHVNGHDALDYLCGSTRWSANRSFNESELLPELNSLNLGDDGDDEDYMLYSYRSAPSRSRTRSKSALAVDRSNDPDFKRLTKKDNIRKEEEKYLAFVEDITNDIIARNISSDRVLKRVFEFHVEKNRRQLDEEKMRKLIQELRDDLQVKDSSTDDDEA